MSITTSEQVLQKKWYETWWGITLIVVVTFLIIGVFQDDENENKPNGDASMKEAANKNQKESQQFASEGEIKSTIEKREIYMNPTTEEWNNAFKLIDAQQNITAEMLKSDMKVKIYLTDNGLSIDIEKMKKNFKAEDLKILQEAIDNKKLASAKVLGLHVVISNSGISEQQLKLDAQKLVELENSDIDKIFIYFYARKEDVYSNNGSTVAAVVWGPKSGEVGDNVARDNIRTGYEFKWTYISKNITNPAQESEERDRDIYFSYWESLNNKENDALGFDEKSQIVSKKIAIKFNISPEWVIAISDKVIKSKPTEEEIRIGNKLSDRFNKYYDSSGLLSKSNEDKAMIEVAKEEKITVERLSAISAHVDNWEIR